MSLTKVTYAMINGDPVNVLDYGADPTGSSDSTGAINAAIAAGDNIYIPQGTYSINSTISITSANKRILGAGKKTILSIDTNVSLINTTYAFQLLNLQIALKSTQTATVIKLDANTGLAYQANNIDLSGITILGNNADCVAIHFKCTNDSYMAYNNMHDIAVVNEGTKKACLLFEVDNSTSFIQGNTFTNLNIIKGGIQYVCNSVPLTSTRMIGNYFDGTYQTSYGYQYELSGINNAPLWDSAGTSNTYYHKGAIGVNWGNTFYELNGDNEWGTLQPSIFVLDGWAENVEKYKLISTGVVDNTLSIEPKAKRGHVKIYDPCINSFDPRFNLTGMTQTGEIISISNSHRSAIRMTNTATLASDAYLKLPNSACTISKYPEFKIGFRKEIYGFFGTGTPTIWNPRLDAKIGLISDDGLNGVYLRLTGVVGSTDASTIALCYMVAGIETVLDSSLTLSQKQQCYFTLYTDNTSVYIKATRIGFNSVAGILIGENINYGNTTGFKTIAKTSLFDVNTITLNPQFTLTSSDKEAGRAIYHIYGIEYESTEM